MNHRFWNILVFLAVFTAIHPAYGDTQPPSQVAALLGRCNACHGGAKPAGGLNLTTRALALKGGVSGASLVPGKAEQSLFYKRVAAKQMPPQSPLSAEETATLRRWIESGAVWPDLKPQRADENWWALRPLKRPVIPKVQPEGKGKREKGKVSSTTLARNPIDAFIVAELKKHKLSASPPADRVTLIRRVTYDLIGLPPTPREIDAFVRDKSPNAYEKLLDRLLADSRYGERWGRHWLDVARFGESHGFERDQMRPNAWRYRDYVIQAFNQDKSYAQFIREQIAGDVLQPGTQEGIIATGFLVSGPWDEVGHNQVSAVMRERVREEELEEMVGTVSQTFLGMTTNCARCHDHKFDPIPQRDYYRLKAALEGVKPDDRSLLTPEEAKARNARIALLKARLTDLQKNLSTFETRGRERVLAARGSRQATRDLKPLARWTFEADAQDTQGGLAGTLKNGARIAGGRLILDGKGAYLQSAPLKQRLVEKTLEAWVLLQDRTQRGGGVLSVQTTEGRKFDAIVFGEQETGKWIAGSDAFRRTRNLKSPAENAAPDALIHVAIVYRADNSIAVYRNGQPYGEAYLPSGSTLQTYPADQSEVLIGLRHLGAGNGFLNGEIEEARLYDRALSSAEIASSFQAGVDNVTPEELRRALTPEERTQYDTLLKAREEQQTALREADKPVLTYAAKASEPKPTHVLLRGDVESKGEAVAAGGLSCVRTLSSEWSLTPTAPEAERRLKLAAWIASPNNPLTARVIVNRVWHYHFGRGIVGTPNDFGFNGERPSHPELLDWLAATFVEDDQRPTTNDQRSSAGSGMRSSLVVGRSSYGCRGSFKRLHRLILLSNTYRQSSRYSPMAGAKDAENRLLWRFAPQRLEGEAVRDAMLFVSGQLNPRQGGPSFQPFTFFVDNSHFYTLVDSAEPEMNRRTIYRMQVQSAKSPLLETLDCPDPSTKTPRRAITTTPLQAMQMMNSPFVLRQARCFAERLEREAGPVMAGRIRLGYRLAFGRAPSAQETGQAEAFLKQQSLADFCWALLNASEFLYVR
jgi:hypothetical protein